MCASCGNICNKSAKAVTNLWQEIEREKKDQLDVK